MAKNTLKIGIIGCGYIADYYVDNIKNSNTLSIEACFDINKKRLLEFCKYYNLKSVDKIDEIIFNKEINLILNLTPPEHHFKINKKVLKYGKSIFCEKPIALDIEETQILFDLAKKNNLNLWSAPSIIFNDFSKSLRKKILPKLSKDNIVGYGFFETPNLANLNTEKWVSPSGAKWPLENELLHGSVIEHSGYLISLICSIIGPVIEMTSIPSKFLRKSDFKKFNLEKNSFGFNHSIIVLSFANNSKFTLIISEQTKARRSLEIYDKNISLNITDIRDDYSTLIFNDYRDKSFLNKQSNKIYEIARRISNLVPSFLAMPLLTSNPFIYDKRIKTSNYRWIDLLKKRKPANFHYGLRALQIYDQHFRGTQIMEEFFQHCNEINLSINKECFKEKTRTTFNHKKLTDFLNLYDKSKKNN